MSLCRRYALRCAYALAAVLALAACGVVSPSSAQLPAASSPSAASSQQTSLTARQAEDAARQFLHLWEQSDYQSMYGLLSGKAKATITAERFVARYKAIMGGMLVTKVAGDVGGGEVFENAGVTMAKVPLSVVITSSRVGDVAERNEMPLLPEDGAWKVDWTPELIFRDLTATNVVRVEPEDPARGAILDQKGRVLAGPGRLTTVGVVAGNLKDEPKALQALSGFLGIPQENIKAQYAGAQPDWWVPLRDLPESRYEEALTKFANIQGVEVRKKDARVYPQGTVAAHILGYVSPATADDLAKNPLSGADEGDFVGRAGIEEWAEHDLAGHKGGRVLIADSDGDTVRVIAQRKAQAGSSVQLTLDLDVQQQAEAALGDKTGSIVVIDPRDNSILASVSHPAFDPNAFVAGMSDADWQKLVSNPRHPFQNRPALSAYPTGSIFKVVTMAAALERGGFSPDSPFECNGTWTGLPGLVMGDWKPEGHGKLDLQEGLVESCDIVFYELGKKLDTINSLILPDAARQFGLGKPTGVVGMAEAKGTVPDPNWKQQNLKQAWFPGDAVNLAIGQGYMEATPLQMANLYSALARKGDLVTPVLIKQVGDANQGPKYSAVPIGKLPASPATLRTIRDAMKDVAASPKGTAYYAFQGERIPTAAKTGSAENQNPDAHAWFAGYAPAESPEIVVIVMVEGGRAGGEVAAPLGRRIIDAYFKGR